MTDKMIATGDFLSAFVPSKNFSGGHHHHHRTSVVAGVC